MEDKADGSTILIVDDERGPRESLRMILSGNHRVLEAGSGAEALEILHSSQVDLITLDLNMPGMRGDELMRTVRREFPEVEIVVITGCGSVDSAAEGIRYGICDYLQKPFDVVQVSAAVVRALSRRQARRRLLAFLEELGAVVGRERDAHALLDDVQRSQKLRGRLAGLFGEIRPQEAPASCVDPAHTIEFLEVLAETIEARDHFMRGHARRVAFYSGLLAKRVGLSDQDTEHLRIAAFLHDLGKVGIASDVLHRRGALDNEERHLVETHPALGVRVLTPLGLPTAVTLAIRHHHEWWDGSGYPDGVAGEEIPLIGRIIGVVDAFDAMSCERPYRPALGRDVIVRELERFAGVQFDPNLAKEFNAILESGMCDVDPELLADVVSEAQRRSGAGAPTQQTG
jgi:response regulator RpfG family c-di-GMP phosphodiesterase